MVRKCVVLAFVSLALVAAVHAKDKEPKQQKEEKCFMPGCKTAIKYRTKSGNETLCGCFSCKANGYEFKPFAADKQPADPTIAVGSCICAEGFGSFLNSTVHERAKPVSGPRWSDKAKPPACVASSDKPSGIDNRCVCNKCPTVKVGSDKVNTKGGGVIPASCNLP